MRRERCLPHHEDRNVSGTRQILPKTSVRELIAIGIFALCWAAIAGSLGSEVFTESFAVEGVTACVAAISMVA
jgi:hypothetical protein